MRRKAPDTCEKTPYEGHLVVSVEPPSPLPNESRFVTCSRHSHGQIFIPSFESIHSTTTRTRNHRFKTMSLEIDNLVKKFDTPGGEIIAVNDLSIEIEEGEFVVFVGPSGCGKTTTLRCIAGLEEPDEGEIRLNGERIDHLRPQQRDLGMVFQNYALYPHLTVAENIGFGLKNRTNMPEDERVGKVEEIAELMGIDDLLGKKPSKLSGGQQQRVATGRAIVRDTELYLFDEPLSNLDANLRAHMRTEIQRIQERLGTTTIYVTHDQEEAMTMANRIAVMRDGELQQIGTPSDIYNNPVNEFVATFIGEPAINLFDVTQSDGALVNKDFTYSVSSNLRTTIDGQDQMRLGLRPEDIDVVKNGSISATVEVVEHLGNFNLVHFTLSDEDMMESSEEELKTAMVSPSFTPSHGDEVGITFEEETIYLFDSSGETLSTPKRVENSLPPSA